MKERRHARSQDPCEATRLYLETVASKLKLAAIAVANEDGLLIGGALGPASGIFDLEALAAVSPLCTGRKPPKDLVDSVASGKPMQAARLDVAGCTLYLASIGRTAPKSKEIESALGRILAAA